ncbi:MAG: hypothetical protein ACE5EC_06110, partial [Phycisphaerae bacterium]
NGDGFADVIMGKGYWDAGQENEGAAFVFLGETWPANPNQPPVALAGVDLVVEDADENGFETIMVDGSASFDPDGTIVGYTWLEGETVLGTSPVLTTDLPTTGNHGLVLTVTDDAGLTRGDIVTVRVQLVNSTQLFFEGFSGGLGAWITGGDVTLSNTDNFPSPPQVRIGAAGAFLSRSITLPAGATGMTLSYWGKATQFAASDEVRVKVSVDGGPFTTIQTITSAESDDTYHFYGGSAIPLGHSWFPATATNLVLRFESNTTTGLYFIDNLIVRALLANQTPVADAGPDVSAIDADGDGFELFSLDGSASADPDGALVSYAWWEGTTLLGEGAVLGVSFSSGVHPVILSVTDDGGLTAQDSLVITVTTDCQPDGIPDDQQLAGNDANANGIPDECDSPGDLNGNGATEPGDIPLFAEVLLGMNPQGESLADMNHDGAADGMDAQPFVDCILTGACP